MDRTNSTGLGLAVIGHALLFGVLSLSLLQPKPLPKLDVTPIEVSLVDEAALQSAAPDLTPAPAPAPADSAPEPAFEPDIAPAPPEPVVVPEPRPTPPLPKPVAKPVAKPVETPKPVAKPTPPKPVTPAKPAPAKPVSKPATKPATKPVTKPSTKPATAAPVTKPRKPGISLDASIIGNARTETGRSATPAPATNGGMRAQKTAAQWEASFIQSVLKKIQPYWKAPTGADAELLKTNLMIRLNRDGSIASVSVANQSGDTESNRNQKALHAERAIKAVQRAGRFDGLPDELYDIWQTLGPITFDKKL